MIKWPASVTTVAASSFLASFCAHLMSAMTSCHAQDIAGQRGLGCKSEVGSQRRRAHEEQRLDLSAVDDEDGESAWRRGYTGGG